MHIHWLLFGGFLFQHMGIIEPKNEYIRTPSYRWDEEPVSEVSTPPGMDDPWRDFTEGYLYGGLLIAGQNEFSWVVDLRSNLLGEQLWGIGMLLSKNRVLTTCRLFQILEKKKRTTYLDFSVFYFSQNVDETPLHPTDSLTKILSETDWVAGNVPFGSVHRHPQCSIITIEYDTAVIYLEKDIPPYVPQVDFAPVPIDKLRALILDYDLSKMSADKVVCYVASVGRNYRNLEGPDTFNYKTKLRVYWTNWSECDYHWRHICDGTEEAACAIRYERVTNVMCFKSRAKVGSICDQDRGASLVCRGVIMGMVTRGALWKFCNNVLHVPFVVIKAKMMAPFLRGETYEDNQHWKSPSFNFSDILPINPQPPKGPIRGQNTTPPETFGLGTRTQVTNFMSVLVLIGLFQ